MLPLYMHIRNTVTLNVTNIIDVLYYYDAGTYIVGIHFSRWYTSKNEAIKKAAKYRSTIF